MKRAKKPWKNHQLQAPKIRKSGLKNIFGLREEILKIKPALPNAISRPQALIEQKND
jgi:hypothetical protein